MDGKEIESVTQKLCSELEHGHNKELVMHILHQLSPSDRAEVGRKLQATYNSKTNTAGSESLPPLKVTFTSNHEDLEDIKFGKEKLDRYDTPEQLRVAELMKLVSSYEFALLARELNRLDDKTRLTVAKEMEALSKSGTLPGAPVISLRTESFAGDELLNSVAVVNGNEVLAIAYERPYSGSLAEALPRFLLDRTDSNHSGFLSEREIDRMVVDRSITAESAAQIAYLKESIATPKDQKLSILTSQIKAVDKAINTFNSIDQTGFPFSTAKDGILSEKELRSRGFNEPKILALLSGKNCQQLLELDRYLRSEYNQLVDRSADVFEKRSETSIRKLKAVSFAGRYFESLDTAQKGTLWNTAKDGTLSEKEIPQFGIFKSPEIIALLKGHNRPKLFEHQKSLEEQTRHSEFIVRSVKKPFASDNKLDSIRPSAVEQGATGNCGFLAALTSLAATQPDAIADMINAEPDGTYTVSFKGSLTGADGPTKVNIEPPTDAELALYRGGTKYGIWPAILQKAYGQLRGGTVVPEEGGNGTDTVTRELHLLLNDWAIDLELKNENATKIDAVLRWRYCGKSRSPITAGTGAHAYAVLDYIPCPSDPAASMVLVRNPWGKGDPLLNKAKEPLDGIDDGTCKMTLEEFMTFFKTISTTIK